MKHAENISCVTLSGTCDESSMGYHRGSALPFSNYQPKSFYNDIISLAKNVGPAPVTTTITTTTTITSTKTTK